MGRPSYQDAPLPMLTKPAGDFQVVLVLAIAWLIPRGCEHRLVLSMVDKAFSEVSSDHPSQSLVAYFSPRRGGRHWGPAAPRSFGASTGRLEI